MEAIAKAMLEPDATSRLALDARKARAAQDAASARRKRLIALLTLCGLGAGLVIAVATGARWLDGVLTGSFVGMGVGAVVAVVRR